MDEHAPHLLTERMSDIAPEAITWLWPDRIPRGKLTLIVGDPGLGKSFLTLDVASRLSRGTPWPDARDNPTEPGNVVILSAEDDLADTIRPRLDAAGADCSRVHTVTGVKRYEDDDGSFFCLDTDLRALETHIVTSEAQLVIVDPITAYMGLKRDGNSNTDVRSILGALSLIAMRQIVAVVVVSHLNKQAAGRAVYRSIGSIAFTAAARMGWLVCKDKDDDRRRLFLPIKANIIEEPSGLAFTIDDGRVHWSDEPVSVDADTAIAENAGNQGERERAEDWLEGLLATGPMAVKEIHAAARAECLSLRTLERAKKALNVRAERSGAGWAWRLQDRQVDNGKPPF